MSDGLFQLSSLWVWIIVVLALVALFAFIVLSAMVRNAANSAESDKGDKKKTPAQPDSAPPADAAAMQQGASMEPVSTCFARGMKFLRESVSGSNYRYQLPWYLVMGDPGAGKFSLTAGAGLNLWSEGRLPNKRRPLEWYFHDEGVLIGLSGRYFKSVDAQPQLDFGKFLSVLQNNRPRRPLDGVVLAIPASDLMGPNALDAGEIAARANHYYEMLSHAQRVLGFSFPVYVVVTKCDAVEGFREFSGELPRRSQDEIFGWSNTYHIDAAFSPEWVGEAFDSVSRDLQRLQSEIFVERSELQHPDEVFLFPENFARLREPLSIYLDRLFRETAYREAFRMRGIYFCGDIEPEIAGAPQLPALGSGEEENEWPPRIAPAETALAITGRRRVPIFVKDLFQCKIFPECGLARPVTRTLLAKSRTVRIIQLSAACLALILSIGTAFGYHKLATNRDLLLPPLRDMYNKRIDENRLLQELYAADRVDFRSIFIPASLTSDLNEQVPPVMTVACDNWILGLVRGKLMQRKLEALPRTGEDAQEQAAETTTADLLGPTQLVSYTNTAEYQELGDLVTRLRAFQDNVETYERIRQSGRGDQLQRIRELLAYVGLNQIQPSGHLAQALRNSNGKPIEVTDSERKLVADTMEELITGMFEAWANDNLLVRHAQTAQAAISRLNSGAPDTLVARLRSARDQISQLSADTVNSDFRWAANRNLDLPPNVQRYLVNPIALPTDDNIGIVGRQIGQHYLDTVRQRVFDVRTPMTDQLLSSEPFGLSAGLRRLQLVLENTINLRFMTDMGSYRNIEVRMRDDQRLIWKLEPLQEALRMHDAYREYDRVGLNGAPDALRAPLRRLALEQLRRYDEDLVAGAQEFHARNASLSNVGLEDETLPELNSFRDAAEPLLQIADRFKDDASSLHNAILRIMVVQAYNLLVSLDKRLDGMRPYTANERNWAGKGSMALALFSAKSPAALQEYVMEQREKIRMLVQQSDKLVPFLIKELPIRGSEQTRLFTRWQRLIDDYQQYDTKRPNGSIAQLEDYITAEMDKIPDTGCMGRSAIPDGGQDYFLQIRNGLHTAASSRCRDISAASVCQTYARIANVFNQRLLGKYPFIPLNATRNLPEAEPADIEAFYQELDHSGKMARAPLQNDERFGEAGQQALRFLDRMQALREIMIPSGAEVQKEPPLTLDISPQFRANRGQETAGNQIVDWTMQVGNQIFQLRQPERPGRWRAGNAIRLALRFANDSAYVPVMDGQPNLKVVDRNAFFEFTNRWSLLTFLTRQDAVALTPAQAGGQPAYMLRFRLKTKADPRWTTSQEYPSTSTATVYLQLRIYPAGGKNAIHIPEIPQTAPVLQSPCEP